MQWRGTARFGKLLTERRPLEQLPLVIAILIQKILAPVELRYRRRYWDRPSPEIWLFCVGRQRAVRNLVLN